MITKEEEKAYDKFINALKAHGFEQNQAHKDVFYKGLGNQFHIEVETDDDWCQVMDAEVYEGETLIAYMKYVESFDDLARFANVIGFSLNNEANESL